MRNQEILNVFVTKKDAIIENTLAAIPNAMRGDNVNRSFYITSDGEVSYSVYLGQIQLDETYFFNIYNHESLDCGDYGYDTDDEMLEDESFIDEMYRDAVEESLNNSIMALEIYLAA